MLTFDKLRLGYIDAVSSVSLLDEQVRFAGTADEFLTSQCEGVDHHVILLDDDVIGFFKVDRLYSETYEFCPKGSIGLRALVIDHRQQGKGIGTQAVMDMIPYLARSYPDFSSVYLTVNCENPGAIRCYLKAGYVDTEALYIGGAAGPQHIMKALLRACSDP